MTTTITPYPTTVEEATARPYPFAVIPDGDGYGIVFPDLPGCSSYARTADEIGAMALEASRGWLASTFARNYPIPAPSEDWDPSPAPSSTAPGRVDGQADPAPPPAYTAERVAEILGVSPARVRQLTRECGVGQKVAGVWMFTTVDLVTLQGRPGMGRPAGPPSTPRQVGPVTHTALTGEIV